MRAARAAASRGEDSSTAVLLALSDVELSVDAVESVEVEEDVNAVDKVDVAVDVEACISPLAGESNGIYAGAFSS